MNAQRGSIWFYLFLTVFLFGLLSFTVTRMLRSGGDMGGTEKTRLNAQTLMDYAARAKVTVQQMKIDGVATSALSFLQVGDGGYTTAPHTAKVFHPEGGGLSLPVLSGLVDTDVFGPDEGVYMTRMAIDGVGTVADDIILSVRGVTRAICQRINEDLTGSTTIPNTGGDNHVDLFYSGNTDLTVALCAACEGVQAMCVEQTTGQTIYTFYSVVDPN